MPERGHLSIRCIDKMSRTVQLQRVMNAGTKSEQLQIRISPTDKARIRDRAAEAGMTVSDWVLCQAFPPVEQQFRALVEALAANPGKRSFAFAAIHDFLDRLSSSELAQSVSNPPGIGLAPFEANYLAAMVEYAAASKGVAPPRWTGAVPPLPEPWFGTSLMSLRLHLLTCSPPPFRRRNLFVDSSIGQRA